MTRVLMPFPADAVLAGTINQPLQARIAPVAWRHFPDGESLVTLDDALDGADVAILASLRNADALALPLRFAARTAREFGARSVGLIAPYLGYMRQDTRFHRGEAVSTPLFAQFLEEAFDWMATSSGGGNDNRRRCARVSRMVWPDDTMSSIRTGVRPATACGSGRLTRTS